MQGKLFIKMALFEIILEDLPDINMHRTKGRIGCTSSTQDETQISLLPMFDKLTLACNF